MPKMNVMVGWIRCDCATPQSLAAMRSQLFLPLKTPFDHGVVPGMTKTLVLVLFSSFRFVLLAAFSKELLEIKEKQNAL